MSSIRKPHSQDSRRRNYVAGIVVAVFLGGAFYIVSVVTDDSAPKKRVVETIALKLVPPPPPPPPKQEPPPEPPKMVEQKIEPPVDKPDDRPKDDAPPPGPLALDAQGSAGSDAFGLGARPGGTDFLIGSNGGGGRGTGGNRFGHYASLMQDQIGRRLHQDDKLDISRFRATIRVWVSDAGKVEKVELSRTTGDDQLDQRIEQIIDTMPILPEAPPKEMPQPVIVRIGATPGLG
jgi:TonB family protein